MVAAPYNLTGLSVFLFYKQKVVLRDAYNIHKLKKEEKYQVKQFYY